MNSQVCKFYLKGSCKRGNKCRFKHQSFPLLPWDILIIIFKDQYISDLQLVCKLWQQTIENFYPLQLYVYSNIRDRDYSYKCAVSIARCKLDAILNICKRCFTIKSNPECSENYYKDLMDSIFFNKMSLYMKIIKYSGKNALAIAHNAYLDLISESHVFCQLIDVLHSMVVISNRLIQNLGK
jgi:hypothetical protein